VKRNYIQGILGKARSNFWHGREIEKEACELRGWAGKLFSRCWVLSDQAAASKKSVSQWEVNRRLDQMEAKQKETSR
jgi:hypothetical protein